MASASSSVISRLPAASGSVQLGMPEGAIGSALPLALVADRAAVLLKGVLAVEVGDVGVSLVGVLREIVLERGIDVLVHAHVAGRTAVDAVEVAIEDLLDLGPLMAHLDGLGVLAVL